MPKTYKIKLNNYEFHIQQDDDGIFIKPDLIKQLESVGTALKPAVEPIVMARRPLSEKSVAENVLKWKTGGINIDESRVGTETMTEGRATPSGSGCYQWNKEEGMAEKIENPTQHIGRFPANLIHDNSEEVRECFPDAKGGAYPNERGKSGIGFASGKLGGDQPAHQMGDSGNASRFFKSIIYQAKASKSERNMGCEGLEEKDKAGKEFRPNHAIKAELGEDGNPFGRWGKISNNHPTVKPVALMEYLIKMITPKGGIVLDPFMGSGSTGIACKKNGFDFIGIEKEPEYMKIAEARINNAKLQQKLI